MDGLFMLKKHGTSQKWMIMDGLWMVITSPQKWMI